MSDRPHSILARGRSVIAALRTPSSMSRLINGGFWTLTAKVFSQVAQLAAFILAARFLTSAEFGFYALSSALALFFVAFAEGGWGEFVMKTSEDADRLNQIATVALLSGTLATAVGLLSATMFSQVFHSAEEATLIGLFSCWLLPSSITTVYDGILVARGRLNNQALIRILAETFGFCIIAVGFWTGWGIVALVFGRLATQIVSLCLSAVVLRWIPRLRLEYPFLLELLEFSRHIVLNRLIVLTRSYSATLVVGSFLGLAEAGLYRAAERIVAAFSELIGEPARVLAWTILRRAAMQHPPEDAARRIGATATKFMIVLMTISLPIYTGLALVSGNLVHFALGDTWAPAALLITLLSLKQILLIPGYVTEPLLSLSGTIRKMPFTVLANSLVGIGCLLAFVPFGMLATACGQCAASIVSFFISVRLQGRYGELDWGTVQRKCGYLALALLAMVAAVLLLGDIASTFAVSRMPTLVIQIVAGATVYFAGILALQKLKGGLLPGFGPVPR
jgi:O-antigen/teichoic acid export membrane protein